MQKKKFQAVAVVSEGLAEWLKALEPGGRFRIKIPPKRLNEREMAVLHARTKALGVDPTENLFKFVERLRERK